MTRTREQIGGFIVAAACALIARSSALAHESTSGRWEQVIKRASTSTD